MWKLSPKNYCISNRDASNVQVTAWQTNATRKKDEMSEVSSMLEIALRITRDVRSTKTYKRKPTHLYGWKNIILPHKLNIPYKLNQD
jgi:hypothetical protein